MRIATLGLIFPAGSALACAEDAVDLVSRGDGAAANCDARQALDLYLAANLLRPDDPLVLQKIARQYSDLADDLPTPSEKLNYAAVALTYAERAVRLEPGSAKFQTEEKNRARAALAPLYLSGEGGAHCPPCAGPAGGVAQRMGGNALHPVQIEQRSHRRIATDGKTSTLPAW